MPSAGTLGDARILAAYLIVFGSYFVLRLGQVPVDEDRPARRRDHRRRADGRVRHLGTDEALESGDFATIVPLFAMMLFSANLRLGGSVGRRHLE